MYSLSRPTRQLRSRCIVMNDRAPKNTELADWLKQLKHEMKFDMSYFFTSLYYAETNSACFTSVLFNHVY